MRRALFRSLREKARPLGLSPAALRTWLHSQGYSAQEIDDAFSREPLEQLIESQLQKLVPRAAAMIDLPPPALRKKLIVKLVDSQHIACEAGRTPTLAGKRRLNIHAGFLFFFNKLSYAYASEMLKANGEAEIPWAVPEAAILLDAFYGRHEVLTAWSVPARRLTQRQQLLSAVFVGCVQEATIAHELGHVVHDLAGAKCIEAQIKRDLPTLLQLAGHLGDWDPQWSDELVADVIAAQLLDAPTFDGEFTAQHALIVLILIIDMIEGRATPGELQPSHPPARVRRAVLKREFPHLESAQSIARFEDACHSIMMASR